MNDGPTSEDSETLTLPLGYPNLHPGSLPIYELPALPPELLFKSFIPKKEEHDMGVPNEDWKDE
jgi:hypothetical protein